MTVEIVQIPDNTYNFDKAWDATSARSWSCSNCGAKVRITDPSDIEIVVEYFLRATCPNCKAEESVKIFGVLGAFTHLNEFQSKMFADDLFSMGAKRVTYTSSGWAGFSAFLVLYIFVMLGLLIGLSM